MSEGNNAIVARPINPRRNDHLSLPIDRVGGDQTNIRPLPRLQPKLLRLPRQPPISKIRRQRFGKLLDPPSGGLGHEQAMRAFDDWGELLEARLKAVWHGESGRVRTMAVEDRDRTRCTAGHRADHRGGGVDGGAARWSAGRADAFFCSIWICCARPTDPTRLRRARGLQHFNVCDVQIRTECQPLTFRMRRVWNG